MSMCICSDTSHPHTAPPCYCQEPGDTLFVPSGYHHTVHNLEDCLSINHNWINAHNVHWSWALVQQEYRGAAAAIQDCR